MSGHLQKRLGLLPVGIVVGLILTPGCGTPGGGGTGVGLVPVTDVASDTTGQDVPGTDLSTADGSDLGPDTVPDVQPELPPPATCSDGVKGGAESDIDCGGACLGCATGKFCVEHGDCLSGSCLFGVCRDPSCDDEVRNQGETDVDCGGSKCDPCAEGGACGQATDCAAALLCDAAVCCAPNACGGGCGAAPAETCDGVDNDCDGETDEGVQNACGDCGAVPAEACDGVDNDCDGQTDEGVLNACGACGAAPAETCDGVDNDCDGETDEGVLNACGDCGPAPAEVCDGVDNDCDGGTDEGVLNPCGDCGPVPSEVCDGADNDCDGQTDEGLTCEAPGCGGVIISEYFEGAGWNKALEITNLGSTPVGYADLRLWLLSNPIPGSIVSDGTEYSFNLTGELPPGGTFVVCHPDAELPLASVCDDFVAVGMQFNGNDAVGIVVDGLMEDKIGSLDGSGLDDAWTVNGVLYATKNHRLVRQSWVQFGELFWEDSVNTWDVFEDSAVATLGTHDFVCPD